MLHWDSASFLNVKRSLQRRLRKGTQLGGLRCLERIVFPQVNRDGGPSAAAVAPGAGWEVTREEEKGKIGATWYIRN